MNVFLLTDLEGIPDVLSIDAVSQSGSAYQNACLHLTKCVNQVAAWCREAGATRVYFLDGHGGGGNIIQNQLNTFAEQVDISGWQNLLKQGKIDCQIELGAHARAGTIDGFLDHTINSGQWFSYRINGKEYSELAIHAVICGIYNVPVVCCIGDEATCRQAKEYIPNIVTAPVKRALCRNEALAFPDAEARIYEAIAKVLAEYRHIEPMQIQMPATIELTFYRTDMCEAALRNCSTRVQRVDARTLRKTITHLERYEELKFG